eukprot:CAMPEP_0201689344 /NCGR_PEP_ID=MMETSP0578-20130828/2957_1 /ASSEMBLY_ACC=CAM_ASM_000663 /TAXON_ID=267565 /ORGANISM="Skeletonema grethea, Strain CCMP 1804" /LENGTH=271 /DNA_ID=CAMNT_0048173959 /DNA_START=26 /DNA_END=837 /DNA_ORIENTATION=-
MSDNNDNQRHASFMKELFEFLYSESPSEDGLREIIDRHGLTQNNILGDGMFLRACRNERVTEGGIRCLLEYFPGVARTTTEHGLSPLHFACFNKSVTRGVIQLLIDAAPDSVRSVNNLGHMPLHVLCANKSVDETAAVEILKLLIEKHPESVRYANNGACLPIHIAAQTKSPGFCQVLIEAYPGSKRIGDSNGLLPLNHACMYGFVATVEFLYKLYPDAVNHTTTNGLYPIHAAIAGVPQGSNPEGAMKIVQYLLDCDPNVKLQKFGGKSL